MFGRAQVTGLAGLSIFCVLIQACGGGPHIRSECASQDDPECHQPRLVPPKDSDLKTGRSLYERSLKQTIADMRRKDPSLPTQVTYFVDKSDLEMQVKLGDAVVRTYGISLGFEPVGHKSREGDGKTPEGTYYVAAKNPNSRFFRSLLVSYPRIEDAEKALSQGAIKRWQFNKIKRSQERCGVPLQNTALGGAIMIHGGGGGPGYKKDWTLGCVALTDSDMAELYEVARSGCEKNGDARIKLVIQP